MSDKLSSNFDIYLDQKVVAVAQNTEDEEDGITTQVRQLYPMRETEGRYSISNPLARFSTTHDNLRESVRQYQEEGLPRVTYMQDASMIGASPLDCDITMTESFLLNIGDLFSKVDLMEETEVHND